MKSRKLIRILKRAGARPRKNGKRFFAILHGPSADRLEDLPDETFDALITDPPSGLGVVASPWDLSIQGYTTLDEKREAFLRDLSAVFNGAYRVLKPGAWTLVWAHPRSVHWTMRALEEADFEIRDLLAHLKAYAVPRGAAAHVSMYHSNCIDPKAYGNWLRKQRKQAKLTVDGLAKEIGTKPSNIEAWESGSIPSYLAFYRLKKRFNITDDATAPYNIPGMWDKVRKWKGWNTTLRQVSEYWILARRPWDSGTLTDNLNNHGIGALNCNPTKECPTFPSNVLFSHHPCCTKNRCVISCDVKSLETHKPGASLSLPTFRWTLRDLHNVFRFVPQVSKKDKKHAGIENTHETIKPQGLMRWLVQLICPPGSRILDCYNGSGSTGIAALDSDCDYVGIEREKHNVRIARKRLYHTLRSKKP